MAPASQHPCDDAHSLPRNPGLRRKLSRAVGKTRGGNRTQVRGKVWVCDRHILHTTADEDMSGAISCAGDWLNVGARKATGPRSCGASPAGS